MYSANNFAQVSFQKLLLGLNFIQPYLISTLCRNLICLNIRETLLSVMFLARYLYYPVTTAHYSNLAVPILVNVYWYSKHQFQMMFVMGLSIFIIFIILSLKMQRRNATQNRTANVRCPCRKTTVLCCHRCLINTGVEKMNNN